MTPKRTGARRLCAEAISVGTYLDPLHLQEGGRLEGLLPDQQLAVQLHAEEHVLPALRLDAEAVFPLVQEVVVLEQTAQRPGQTGQVQVNSIEARARLSQSGNAHEFISFNHFGD